MIFFTIFEVFYFILFFVCKSVLYPILFTGAFLKPFRILFGKMLASYLFQWLIPLICKSVTNGDDLVDLMVKSAVMIKGETWYENKRRK